LDACAYACRDYPYASTPSCLTATPSYAGQPTSPPTTSSSDDSWPSFEKGLTWQWQLIDSERIDDSYDVDVYDIDLFDVPKSTITSLKAQGRKVICYFSGGSSEDWRSDFDSFEVDNSVVLGNALDGWEGERWLDIRRWDILESVMRGRMELAVSKGCDGVEPDNMDGYQNNNGFNLVYADQLTYNKLIAELAHSLGLAVGLKNDLDQISSLVEFFDFAVNEQCNEYEECSMLQPFLDNNKAVFGVEYTMKVEDYCSETNDMDMDWLAKNWDLDSCVYACRDYPSTSTPDCLTDGLPSRYIGTAAQTYDDPSGDDGDDITTTIVIIVLVVLLVVIIIGIGIYCKMKKDKLVDDEEIEVEVSMDKQVDLGQNITTTEN